MAFDFCKVKKRSLPALKFLLAARGFGRRARRPGTLPWHAFERRGAHLQLQSVQSSSKASLLSDTSCVASLGDDRAVTPAEIASLSVSSQACVSLNIGVWMGMQLISETPDSERGEKRR